MDCQGYRILISGYIDGELSDAETQELKGHLQDCGDCLSYLKRLETMETVLKRYQLLQEVPDVSEDFARNLTAALHTKFQHERVPWMVRWRQKGRRWVIGFVEGWATSLRQRPFAWVMATSVFVVFLAGVMFVEVLPGLYDHTTLSPSVEKVAQESDQYVEIAPAAAPEAYEAPRTGADTQAEKTVSRAKPMTGNRFAADEATEEETTLEMLEEQPFIQVAQTRSSKATSLDDYVYSHVIEIAQDHLIDDAVFAGYVQDAMIE